MMLRNVGLTALFLVSFCSLGNCSFLRGELARHIRPLELSVPAYRIDGLNDTTGALTNICECECCFEASPGHEECYSTSALVFEVNTCSSCDARQCASTFQNACTAKSSLIKALCVQRSAWYVSWLPILFIAFTAVLLLRGMMKNNPFPTDSYSYSEIRDVHPSVAPKALGALQDVDTASK